MFAMTLIALLSSAPAAPTIAEGERHRRDLLERVQQVLRTEGAACSRGSATAAGPSLPAGTTESPRGSMSVACANVLRAFHQGRAPERAVRDAPLRRPRVRCPSLSPGKTVSSLALERWTLSKCLTKTFGPGVLAPVVDADFTFIVGRHVITGTGVVVRQSDVSFTVLEDDVDGIGSSNEVIAATASLSTLPDDTTIIAAIETTLPPGRLVVSTGSSSPTRRRTIGTCSG